MNKPKIAGSKFEKDVADYLVDNGFPLAERAVTAGSNDKGDITGIPGWCLELKAEKKIDLATAQKEAVKEAKNRGVSRFVSIHKRRQHGVGDAYCVLPLWLFAELIREG